MSEIIRTDHPLDDVQQATLVALLNTLIPPSDDGRLPGAGSLDLRAFMDNVLNPDFERAVKDTIETLGEAFAALSTAEQEAQVTSLSTTHPDAFAALYLQALAVYYRQDAVLLGIGSGEGPPFPRGNDVADGDMTLLDPVITNPKPYRQA